LAFPGWNAFRLVRRPTISTNLYADHCLSVHWRCCTGPCPFRVSGTRLLNAGHEFRSDIVRRAATLPAIRVHPYASPIPR
jgi:hypothetical protein